MNRATFGGAIDFSHEDGYFFVNNSMFLNHTALNPTLNLGSGSVFRMGADIKAYLETYRNTYINNIGASRGKNRYFIYKYSKKSLFAKFKESTLSE